MPCHRSRYTTFRSELASVRDGSDWRDPEENRQPCYSFPAITRPAGDNRVAPDPGSAPTGVKPEE